MTVKRIVTNIATRNLAQTVAFYRDMLGMDVVMDHGWIVTLAGVGTPGPQVSVATEGGSGTPVPDISIEVDDLDEVHARMRRAAVAIEYGPASEPWGVRRFYVRDPAGRLVNILVHETG